MDYWTRLILALIIGLGAAFALNYFFGNLVVWLVMCCAVSLATESALQTIKNVGAPPNPIIPKKSSGSRTQNNIVKEKPLKPKF